MINHISQMLRNQSEVLPGHLTTPGATSNTSISRRGLPRIGSIDWYFSTAEQYCRASLWSSHRTRRSRDHCAQRPHAEYALALLVLWDDDALCRANPLR
jgi:hypothetical protein